jgi:putative peptide zinc metalloprotease protein
MGIFSPYWYRVENLKPRLAAHARIQRHHYRGERWHVIEDPASGRYHRFGPNVYYVIALMDGERTVSEIWNAALTRLGDDAPAQNELIVLLSQLHTADLLKCDVTPDTAEVFDRFTKARTQKWLGKIINPAFARIPLWDPDAWLGRWVHLAEWIFTPWTCVAWFALMVIAGLQVGTHWNELTAPSLSAILEPQNLLILLISYPLVKLLHELGHAVATRVFGGEVHEVGIMFLVFVPMPYVDASASSAFGSKWRRIAVASAGVMVELFVSALALFVWLEISPGFPRTVLWNVMLIGGVSTLFFNGNPLLRFDGYYVVADLLEIPNLSGRSGQYLRYLLEHYVMGLPERRRIPLAPGERGWLIGYGVLSWVYRLSVTLGIALYLASQFFFVGVLLAVWGIVLQLVVPAVRGLAALKNDPRVEAAKLRVGGTLAGLGVAVVLAIFVVPFPAWSTFEGVVWIPERSQVRAGTDGFITRVVAKPDSAIRTGEILIETVDPELDARVRILEASLAEARAEYARERQQSVATARIQREEVERIRGDLATARRERARGLVRAGEAGRFVLVERDLEARFVRRGDLLGYVAQLANPIVRMIVAQDEIVGVRGRLESVEVRLAEDPGRVLEARLDQVVPTASRHLPSTALGAGGGGAVAVDARDPDGLTASEPFFMVDLALPPDAPITGFGGRVHVRFDYPSEPLSARASRSLRRLFMDELGV